MVKTKSGKKDAEEDTNRSIFSKIVEGIIVFFISALLLRIGVEYILSVRVPLIIIAVVIAIIVIAYRVYIWKRRHDDY